jgi:elongation factor 1 alpha-like protein
MLKLTVWLDQMVTGLAQVRSVLGDHSESGIDDKQIKDALWDSYFDVEGTISWLLGTWFILNCIS